MSEHSRVVISIENEYLRAQLHADASLHITDRASGTRWHSLERFFQEKHNAAEEVVWIRRERVWADVYLGTATATAAASGARVTLWGPAAQRKGAFTLSLSLEDQWLVVRIEDIEESLQSLTFPLPLVCDSLVLPTEIGQWLRHEHCGMSSSLSYQNCGINMRWMGGLAADARNGWMLILQDGFADSGIYRNGLRAAPIWAKSHGRWEQTRSCRYRCTANGYVGMAREFADYARVTGISRSLAEKIEQCPEVAHLRGGRTVSMFQCSTAHADNTRNFFGIPTQQQRADDGKVAVAITHADAAEIMQLARSWGMRKGVFCLRGTFSGGYDECHPDIWPPEPLLGGVEELRRLIKCDGPFLTVLHDNYQDMYPRAPSFPDGVLRTSSGELMHGGHWHGGQCFIICPTQQRRYAERNWRQLSSLGLRGHFIDTAACAQFYECYDSAHPMRRCQDIDSKLRLMAFFKQQGLVLGSENPSDFGMYHLDYIENRHNRLPGVTIPLWPLAFHDSVFFARYGTGGTSGGEPVRQLENFLWGYQCYYPANSLASFRGRERHFRETLALDDWHARIGMDRMVDHRFLAEDYQVEQTEFSSGVALLANFSDEERSVEGVTVPAKGYVIRD